MHFKVIIFILLSFLLILLTVVMYRNYILFNIIYTAIFHFIDILMALIQNFRPVIPTESNEKASLSS